MNILFLSRRFYPDIGGVEKHVLEISKIFVNQGHKVTVVTQSEGKENKIEKINVIRFKSNLTKKETWSWFWKNKYLISEADVIHAHDVYFWYFPFRILFPFKKSYVTFHGYESYPILKRAIIVRKISEKLSNGSIIVGDFIKKWYGANPDFITYGGVNISNQDNQISKINKYSGVFIGRLDEQTGILDYAEAVKLIRKKIPQFEFTIIGSGKYKNKLKEFKVIGSDKNAEKYFKQYNFAFVSRYLSILEALANKRLVFALYDNPVKEDYLKMAPFSKFIIIEKYPERLAEKVSFFLKNPKETENKINDGLEWVKNQKWDKMAKTYLSLWKI